MKKSDVNDCRLLMINYAIELVLKKGKPFDLNEMKKDAESRLEELEKSDDFEFDPPDRLNLIALVEDDLKGWIQNNAPTVEKVKPNKRNLKNKL